jgi:hypothetical protein
MRSPLVFVLLVAAGVLASASAASAASRLPCQSPGSLVEATRSSVLTRAIPALRTGYYACTRGHTARFLGYSSSESGGVQRPRLAGRYAAFAWESCPKEPGVPCSRFVERRRLDTNKRLRAPVPDVRQARFGPVLISTDGTIAWSISIADVGGEIHVTAADGRDRKLAAGPDVDAPSLATSAQSAYWTEAGRPRRALLRDG